MLLDLGIVQIGWRDLVDITVVAYIAYRIILFFKGTRAVSVVYGLIILMVVYYVADEFGLYTLHGMLTNFLGSLFLVIIILFQSDIRKALAEMGAGRLWFNPRPTNKVLDELVLAAVQMAEKKIGALIVLERRTPLGDIVESGVEIDARFSRELLETIFYPNTRLHDGAVVLRANKIVSAGCILPLAVGVPPRWNYGTRHRAAIGITEESDALAVVVSEERGRIAVAISGKLIPALDEVRLRRVLTAAWEK
ncbi:diadenylate cyclase CdaA [Desulfonatronospira sp.]|uniref:diadenylate cyclase CdaA n=1 Tax=Desulfonatronospira sp. TaxID=1962951 RepID=UPI0025C64B05|nr:diadenylate cyclase CdaA [Desulfonatronospira sp.]